MGEAEKALAVLDAYEASNPDNANVHRYKFEHHSKHNNQEEALLSLKVINLRLHHIQFYINIDSNEN